MSGWTKYDTKQTGLGTEQGPVDSDPSNGTRKVRSEQYVVNYTHHWKYYHRYGWAKNVTTGGYGYIWGTDGSLKSGARHEIDLTYQLSVYQNNWAGLGVTAYKGYKCASDNQQYVWLADGEYDVPNYGTRWYYQEPVYTYYYKDSQKEASSDPTGKSDVSNVQRYVKYREK